MKFFDLRSVGGVKFAPATQGAIFIFMLEDIGARSYPVS